MLDSWDDYLAALDAVRAGGGPTDHTMVWWDARPQPRLGTVELREVDVQTDLESAAAIAALARAIMRRAVEAPVTDTAPEQALHWSSFRAARDGLDAEIYYDGWPATAARGGRAAYWRSWTARIPSSRASGESSARATARPGSAPRMSAAACRACSATSADLTANCGV